MNSINYSLYRLVDKVGDAQKWQPVITRCTGIVLLPALFDEVKKGNTVRLQANEGDCFIVIDIRNREDEKKYMAEIVSEVFSKHFKP